MFLLFVNLHLFTSGIFLGLESFCQLIVLYGVSTRLRYIQIRQL